MGDCNEYSISSGGRNDGISCLPVLIHNYVYRFQDNYSLEEDDKWDMVCVQTLKWQ